MQWATEVTADWHAVACSEAGSRIMEAPRRIWVQRLFPAFLHPACGNRDLQRIASSAWWPPAEPDGSFIGLLGADVAEITPDGLTAVPVTWRARRTGSAQDRGTPPLLGKSPQWRSATLRGVNRNREARS